MSHFAGFLSWVDCSGSVQGADGILVVTRDLEWMLVHGSVVNDDYEPILFPLGLNVVASGIVS